MKIEGSCHCGRVRFTANADAPVPFMRCYCSICRKTAGGCGCAVNIRVTADSLQVEGMEHVRAYQPHLGRDAHGRDRGVGPGRRYFCEHCGSALWGSDPRWAQWVYPHASAIDSELPVAPARDHIFLSAKPAWVEVPAESETERWFAEYPEESLEDWHRRYELLSPEE
jgi:hypothetical protein